MPQIEAEMRARISMFLPKALETAMSSYRTFSRQEISGDPVAFKKHHDACKVSVAHIELLIKLARWAELPDDRLNDKQAQKEIDKLMQSAQSEIDSFLQK